MTAPAFDNSFQDHPSTSAAARRAAIQNKPDSFTAPAELASDGGHLPATLFRLANAPEAGGDQAAVYAEVANRLSQLINDVRSVYVDRDERRQLLTIYAKGRDGTAYSARSLSDGTLRFLLTISPASHLGYFEAIATMMRAALGRPHPQAMMVVMQQWGPAPVRPTS